MFTGFFFDWLRRAYFHGAERMHNFSVKQRLHLLVLPLYALARLTMDQWMLKFVPLSFSSQMYFESVVSFRWLLCLRETLWPLKRVLKVFSVIPI